jgi:hypothetical protein
MSADAKAGPTIFTKEMVEKTILFFNDTKRVPDGDQAGMEQLIGAFVRFESVVKQGNVAPGEATALAREFLTIAGTWFQQNPAYAETYRRLQAQLGA